MNIREFRKSKGLSQEAMARKINITLSMYEKVENNRVGTSAAFMRKFKKAFPEILIDDIFFAYNSNDVAGKNESEN